MASPEKNKYDQAASRWVEQHFGYKPGTVSDVDFTTVGNGGCETCYFESAALEFRHNGQYKKGELWNVTAGQFIEQCVALMIEEDFDGD